jgi:hypothetical protein
MMARAAFKVLSRSWTLEREITSPGSEATGQESASTGAGFV